MTICTEHDSEVCYESRYCPACAIRDQLLKSEDKITDLETEISSLKSEIKNLEQNQ